MKVKKKKMFGSNIVEIASKTLPPPGPRGSLTRGGPSWQICLTGPGGDASGR